MSDFPEPDTVITETLKQPHAHALHQISVHASSPDEKVVIRARCEAALQAGTILSFDSYFDWASRREIFNITYPKNPPQQKANEQ
jgi:hypothetical protein